MSQYNQNSICFIGSEDDIKVILLAMSRNQEKSAARLVEDGLRDEEVASLVGISNRVVKKTTIWDMYEECRDNLWNPVYMLDPMSDVWLGGDEGCGDEAMVYRKIEADDGTMLHQLEMRFYSRSGLALDALEAFLRTLPQGNYAVGAVAMYEGDNEVFISDDESLNEEEIRELITHFPVDAKISLPRCWRMSGK